MTIATAFTTLKSKRRTLTRAFAAVLAAATLLGHCRLRHRAERQREGIAEPVDGKTTKVTIGVCAGPYGDMVEEVFAPLLKEKGYEVSTKVFNDYVQPDKALASGKIECEPDAHGNYLKKFSADNDLDLISLGQTPTLV